jgi:hypothetical protein
LLSTDNTQSRTCPWNFTAALAGFGLHVDRPIKSTPT